MRPLPRSLQNIFRELQTDLGLPLPTSGDLSPWCDQGVLMLNRVLTVKPGAPGSHRGKGWETVTAQAIQALVARRTPLVALLWGRDAQSVRDLLGDTARVESVHPSPMSADRGFFGSRPFSRVNQLLRTRGRAGGRDAALKRARPPARQPLVQVVRSSATASRSSPYDAAAPRRSIPVAPPGSSEATSTSSTRSAPWLCSAAMTSGSRSPTRAIAAWSGTPCRTRIVGGPGRAATRSATRCRSAPTWR